jgi:hypothetical protein
MAIRRYVVVIAGTSRGRAIPLPMLIRGTTSPAAAHTEQVDMTAGVP